MPYVEYGTPDERPPVILLNGLGLGPRDWGSFPDELGRNVIAMGRPEGRYAPFVPTMGHYAKPVIAAIHQVVGDRPYDLLGVSWGGFFAQKVADEDLRVRRRIVAAAMPALLGPKLGILLSPAIRRVFSTQRTTIDAGAIYGGDFCDNPELIHKLIEAIDQPTSPRDHMRQVVAVFTGTLAVRRMLRKAGGPETLFMAGTDDPIMRFSTVKRAAHAIGARVEAIRNGGHGFILTRPRESAQIVNGFLNQPA